MKKSIPFILICFSLVSCGDAFKDTFKSKSTAEPQIAIFHERLNSERYDEIYDTATEEYRKGGTREKMAQLFSAINRKLGTVKSSRIVNWRVNILNLTTYVVLVSETEFERGTATETFSFLISGDNAILHGYIIKSLDMMMQ